MSNPYPVDLVVISSQKNSGEILAVASALLSTTWESLTPVGTDKNIREEFLLAFDVFVKRENVYNYQSPKYFAERAIEPSNSISTEVDFWLALDEQGASIAKEIFLANGKSPEEKVYKSVRKVNLIEQIINPSPEISISAKLLLKMKDELSYLSQEYQKLKPEETFQSYNKKRLPITPAEFEYYNWFISLYDNLQPWIKNIHSMQSYWS